MNKQWHIWIIILISLVAVGSGIICLRNGKTVKPKVTPIVEAVYALGIVTPYKEYNLRVGMSTKIEKLYVWEGDFVKAYCPLVRLDGGVILYAPFSGIVAVLNRKESEIVTAQEAIMTIIDPAKMYIRLSLDQESVINVRKKQTVEISFENLRNYKMTGYVRRIYPSGGEFVVAVDVDAFPVGVLPYMTCDVAILVREKEKALLVPQNAVINNMVYVIRNGGKTRVKVTTRQFKDGWLEVLEGDVKPEDSIIIR